MTNKWRGDVPFLDDGVRCEMLTYAASWMKDVLWKPYHEFDDTLILWITERGRSAAHFWWVRESDGMKFPMFMADLLNLAKTEGIRPGGRVTGKWGFTKRGSNYGVYFIG